jgi:hypothetical protein
MTPQRQSWGWGRPESSRLLLGCGGVLRVRLRLRMLIAILLLSSRLRYDRSVLQNIGDDGFIVLIDGRLNCNDWRWGVIFNKVGEK